jgi:hypothetical protein
LREETRQKLDVAAQSERSRDRLALAFGGILVALTGIFFAVNSYPVNERPVSGVVRWAVWKYDHETGQRYPDMQVMLAEGQLVSATTLESGLPEVGSTVNLTERIWIWYPATYRWDRQPEGAGKQ